MTEEEKREASRRQCREWYARNVEKERARKLAYRNQNIEKARAASIAYNRKNLPRLAVIARNRRARQRDNGGKHTISDILEIIEAQKRKCAYCRCKLDDSYHVDHIMPLAKGGANDRKNLQVLCRPCNKTKSAKEPLMFARSLGLLL